ncbi:MAG: leucine-rich repeat protein [Bacteroidales bacterium]|nr:leucine-rich repeat protein [Bacteroidales bacterium]
MKKTVLLVVSLLLAVWLQAQVTHTADVPTAGTLSTVASSYLTTVTNLTVTGTIDARDFKTMRDNMPLLAVLDLSGVTIAAYTGPDGTHPSGGLYPENEIPGRAFYKKTSLTSFTYPSSVTSIGISAFEDCSGLTGELTIPNSVTSIGGAAFRGCSGFTGQLTLPTSIVTLNYAVFRGCSGLTGDLTIPSTVTSIGEQSFYGCSGFTGNLTIPSSVTSIGDIAFGYCTGFTGNLTIPSSVESIGQGAFTNCTGLTGGLTIPPLITTIYDYTFYNCYSLTGDLIIPSSVTSIGSNAFRGCTGFTGELTIPSSVTSIGENVFRGCSALTSIVSLATTPVDLSASSGVFDNVNKTSCTLYVPIGSAALYRAANQWQDFTHIIEGDGFWLWATEANIEKAANSTASIAVHSGVTWTATSNQAWLAVSPSSSSDRDATLTLTAQGNTGIERTATVTVSAAGVANQTIAVNQDGIKEQLLTIASVGNGTVTASPSSAIAAGMEITLSITPNVGYQLKEGSLNAHKTGDETTTVTVTNGKFTMPQFDVTLNAEFVVNSLSVTVNGTDNVSGTSLENALTGINLATIASLEITAGAFNTADWQWLRTKKGNLNVLTHFTITDGIGSVASIPNSSFGNSYFNIVLQEVSVAKVEKIGVGTFYGCSTLVAANFPQATSIGDGAFYNCTSLATANIPQATSLGGSAFLDCSSLLSANFPEVTSIGDDAFYNCTSLATANIPQVTSIGKSAFEACSSLLSANFPQAISVGEFAFNQCNSLAEANFPQATSIESKAFQYCALVNADFPEAVSIGAAAFLGNSTLSVANFPKITIIPDNAFRETALVTASFPEATSIGSSAFTECSLTSVNFPKAISIGNNAFSNNTSLVTVNFPEVTSIEEYAFSQCYSLTSATFPKAISIGGSAFQRCALLAASFPEVTSIEEYAFSQCYSLTSATFPKATSIGRVAFQSCALLTASFPEVTSIGDNAFDNCSSLNILSLGAEPPAAGTEAFYGCPVTRYLVLIDANGNELSGEALTTARSNFKLVEDGNTGDNLWHGWIFDQIVYDITVNDFENGSVASNVTLAPSGAEITLTVTPQAGYQLKPETLKAHKTGDTETFVTIADGKFTMPAYNVTITAEFEAIFNLTVASISNGSVLASPSSKITFGTEVTLTSTADYGYKFVAGSLKAHKTGDENELVQITDGKFSMPAFDVTVTAEFEETILDVTINGTTTLSGNTLENSLNGVDLSTITSLEVTGGDIFHIADWIFLKNVKDDLAFLTHFTIASGVGSVANIPGAYDEDPYFNTNIQEVSVAKVTKVGFSAFDGCTNLTVASFPQLTSVDDYAFYNCASLITLTLGATPPSFVGSETFFNCPETRYLILVDAQGSALSGNALNEAQDAYGNDIGTESNLWYGWIFDQIVYRITDASAENGRILSSVAPGGAEVTLMVLPDAGYKQVDGTLKAHKTNNAEIAVALTNGTFTMPEYGVTVTAQFEVNTLNVTVNGNLNVSGNTLENALNETGLGLDAVSTIEVTGGGFFNTTDWHWLKANRNNLTALTHFTITSGVGSVANIPNTDSFNPYFNAMLQEVSVAKVASIGDGAFYQHSSLSTANFPDATSVGYSAFYECSELSVANFPEVVSIGEEAFEDCISLSTDNFPKVKSIGNRAFYRCSSLSTVNFPAAASIGDRAFFRCSSLSTVNFPQAISIGNRAFYYCSSLSATNFPEVVSIGAEAFEDCSSLVNANFPQAISIDKEAFRDCSSLATGYFPQVTSIGVRAFYKCSSLTTVNFPQVTSIGDRAFYECYKLPSANFPEVESIGVDAFWNCTSLSTLSLGTTPPSVGSDAFYECPAPRYLVLADAEGNRLTGDALTNARIAYKDVDDGDMTDNLWYDWDFAQTVYLVTDNSQNGNIVPSFAAAPSGTEINLTVTPNAEYKLTVGSLEAHKTNDAETVVVITDGAFTMPEYDVTVTAQFEVKTLNVTVNGINYLSGSSLENTLGGTILSSIITLEVTGGDVFNSTDWHWLKSNRDNLSALTHFTITDGVGSVANIPDAPDYVPYFSASLKEVSVAKVERIGISAFDACTNLTTANFPQATTIVKYAFYDCSSLYTANFPEVASIGVEAFYNCTSLTTLTLGSTPPSIGNNVFYQCPAPRYLILADAEGNMLTGDALTNAQIAYKDVDDGDMTDNLWYGWDFAQTMYLVSPISQNGSIVPSYAAAPSNTEVTLTVTPNVGYMLIDGTLEAHKTNDATTPVTITDGKFTMPAYDVTVTAQFEGLPQTLTVATVDNGSITASPSTDIVTDTEITLTVTPSVGYQLKDGSLNAYKTDNQSVSISIIDNKFFMPAYGATVTAEFEVIKYNLTYTAGANGSLTGETVQTVNYGTDGTTVTAVPNNGYHFVKWSDDVTSNPRTDVNVTADVTVEAEFAINTYTLTYTAGANGTLTGETVQTVNHGTDGTAVTAVANTGYDFVQWSDGSTANPRTDVNVTGDVTVEAEFAINTYTLTYTAGANGSLTGETTQTVNYGTDGTTITAVADINYHFVKWSDGVTTNPRTEANVVADVTVEAEFAINTYTLTYTAGANGSLTGESVQTVNYGTDGTAVTAVPNDGYHFVKWSDDVTANPRTDANVVADVTVEAEFAINTYTLTYTAGANGSLTGESVQTVNHGSDANPVTAVPNAGYHFVKWSDDVTANPRTDANVVADVTVEAEFAINTYTIAATAGENGTISPAGEQTVEHGSSLQFTFTPDANFHVASVLVDGVSVGLSATYTFSNIHDNHTISVTFAETEPITFAITATAGANGTISPSGEVQIGEGEDITFAIAADHGFNINDVSVDGVSVGSVQTYTFENVTADHTIEATFTIKSYTLTFELIDADETPIAGATITINELDLTSDSDGKAEISLTNGNYPYSISLDGYEVVSDEVIISDEDQTVKVNMVKLGLDDNSLSRVNVYPNPFSNRLVVSNAGDVSRIVVNNLMGQPIQVLTNKNANPEWIINTSSLKLGIYLVTLYSADGKRVVRKVVKE